MSQPQDMQRLGELLIEEGIVTVEELTKVLEETGKKNSLIGQLLLSAGHVRKEDLLRFVAQSFKIPQAHLGDLRISTEALKLVPFEVASKHELIPLERIGGILCVAKGNYFNRASVIELRRLTNLKVKVIQVDAGDVQKAIQYYYKGVGEAPVPSQAAGPARVETQTGGSHAPVRESTPVYARPSGPPVYAIWVPREDALSIARIWKEDTAADWERTYASDQPILASKITR